MDTTEVPAHAWNINSFCTIGRGQCDTPLPGSLPSVIIIIIIIIKLKQIQIKFTVYLLKLLFYLKQSLLQLKLNY